VIRSFRHRGLRRLYEDDDRRGVPPAHVEKIRRILARLDEAQRPRDMALPGYRLHPLGGTRKGEWAVWVSENWRIVFRFEGPDAHSVNYEDYH
jgi:proteic killer suppression protein